MKLIWSRRGKRMGRGTRLSPRRRLLLWKLLLALSVCFTASAIMEYLPPIGADSTGDPALSASSHVTPTNAGIFVARVYFSKHPESDVMPQAVFPRERETHDPNVAAVALQDLLAGPTPAERAAGYFTPLTTTLAGDSICGGPDTMLSLGRDITRKDPDAATVRICRALPALTSDDTMRIRAEITATVAPLAGVRRVVVLGRDGACLDQADAACANPLGYPVRVFFSKHPDSDTTPDVVVPVERTAPDLRLAPYALRQLFAGPSPGERASGYFTPALDTFAGSSACSGADYVLLPNQRGMRQETNTTTVKFCRQVVQQDRLAAIALLTEIQLTLLQFPDTRTVVVLTSDDRCFADYSGLNRCLDG